MSLMITEPLNRRHLHHAYTAMSRARAWDDVDISSLDLEAFAVDREPFAEYRRLVAL